MTETYPLACIAALNDTYLGSWAAVSMCLAVAAIGTERGVRRYGLTGALAEWFRRFRNGCLILAPIALLIGIGLQITRT